MKAVYDKVSHDLSRLITNSYSTSFSLGIYFLHKRIRHSIYAIYGFVRLADEIVDSFDGFDRHGLLQRFKEDARAAIENGISVNPVLNSFQFAVQKYQIPNELIDTFLESMEMDLGKIDFDSQKYKRYILGSAEVVGLMCLHIFTEGNRNVYEELRPYAMKLGAAFQKVNFLRDMKDDYEILGRTYFPNVQMTNFNADVKTQIENEIEDDFRIAYQGIRKLPSCSRGGVYLAYVYYRSLFNKIKRLPPHRILAGRIRIHNGKKFSLMLNSLVEHKMNLL